MITCVHLQQTSLSNIFGDETEYPLLSNILQKHEVESNNELGQAQFAEVLQPVLQELADALAKKPYVAIQNIKITNGARIKKVNHSAIPRTYLSMISFP